MTAEAHFITCTKGHTIAATKSGDDDVAPAVIRYYGGKCMYCGGELSAVPATVNDYEAWSTRSDQRYAGSGAP